MHRDLVVAIDGGGTKTVLIIADASCRVLGVGRGGPLNAVFVAEQEAIASVRQAATAALARTGLTRSAVGGDELAVGKYKLRNMATREEELLTKDELLSRLCD